MKLSKESSVNFLRIFIGLVFLSAGIYRIFFFQSAVSEFNSMGTPIFFLFVAIIVEIGAGLLLILNRQVIAAAATMILFLLIALVISFINAGKSFFENASELFSLTPTPDDIFLHITYLVILVVLLLYGLKKK